MAQAWWLIDRLEGDSLIYKQMLFLMKMAVWIELQDTKSTFQFKVWIVIYPPKWLQHPHRIGCHTYMWIGIDWSTSCSHKLKHTGLILFHWNTDSALMRNKMKNTCITIKTIQCWVVTLGNNLMPIRSEVASTLLRHLQ